MFLGGSLLVCGAWDACRTEYLFKFSTPFEIHDDVDILKRMGLAYGIEEGTCTDAEVAEAKKMIPDSLAPFLDDMVANARARARGETTQSQTSAVSAASQQQQQQQQQQSSGGVDAMSSQQT